MVENLFTVVWTSPWRFTWFYCTPPIDNLTFVSSNANVWSFGSGSYLPDEVLLGTLSERETICYRLFLRGLSEMIPFRMVKGTVCVWNNQIFVPSCQYHVIIAHWLLIRSLGCQWWRMVQFSIDFYVVIFHFSPFSHAACFGVGGCLAVRVNCNHLP